MSEVKEHIKNLKTELRRLPEDALCGYDVVIQRYMDNMSADYTDSDIEALKKLEDSLEKYKDDGCPALSYDMKLSNMKLEVIRNVVYNLTEDIINERLLPGTADDCVCDLIIRVDGMPAGYGGILLCFDENEFLFFYTEDGILGVEVEDARVFGVGDLVEMLRISAKLSSEGYTVLFYEVGE